MTDLHITIPNTENPFDAPWYSGPLSEVASELVPGEYVGTTDHYRERIMVTIWEDGNTYFEYR